MLRDKEMINANNYRFRTATMMHSKKYIEYLNSSDWYTKREEKLKQARWKCEKLGYGICCGSLQVHHLHYDNLGNELLSDLVVLCEIHHSEADENRRFEIWLMKNERMLDGYDEYEIRDIYHDETESLDLHFENNYDDDWDKR